MKTYHCTILAIALGTANIALAQEMPPMPGAAGELIHQTSFASFQLLFVDEDGNSLVLSDSYDENDGVFSFEQNVSSIDADGDVTWTNQLNDDSNWSFGRVSLNESQLLVSFQQFAEIPLLDASGADPAIAIGITSGATKLSAIETETGGINWSLELNGDLYDLAADDEGGWRIQYTRYSEDTFEYRLVALSEDGSVNWDIALD